MSAFFKAFFTLLLSLFTKYFGEFLLTIKELLKYLNGKHEDKDVKKQQDFEKKVDDVIDNGNIEDLMNLRK